VKLARRAQIDKQLQALNSDQALLSWEIKTTIGEGEDKVLGIFAYICQQMSIEMRGESSEDEWEDEDEDDEDEDEDKDDEEE
jgi:hypothetical protein